VSVGGVGDSGGAADVQQVDQDDQQPQAADSSNDTSETTSTADEGTPDVDDSHANDSFANGLMDQVNNAMDAGAATNAMGATGAQDETDSASHAMDQPDYGKEYADRQAAEAAAKTANDPAASANPGTVGGGPAKNTDSLPSDPKSAIGGMTQKQGSAGSQASGEDRCGATVVAARVLDEKGYQGLQDLNQNLQNDPKYANDPRQQQALADLNAAAQKLPPNGPGTYQDLGNYNDALARLGSQGNTQGGMGAGPMNDMMDKAGLSRPKTDESDPTGSMKYGESFPVKVNGNLDPKGEGNHYVLHGKDDQGQFFYDPYPKPGQSQVVRQGTPDFDKYSRAMRAQTPDGYQKPGTGYVPPTN
jgi:hypothetical protein